MSVRVNIECTGRQVILNENDLGFLATMVECRFGGNITFPSGFTVNAAEMAELQEGMRKILAD